MTPTLPTLLNSLSIMLLGATYIYHLVKFHRNR